MHFLYDLKQDCRLGGALLLMLVGHPLGIHLLMSGGCHDISLLPIPILESGAHQAHKRGAPAFMDQKTILHS